jgi:hypothetical protein
MTGMSVINDFDAEDLDCLRAIGLRCADRSDDFFAEIRREEHAQLLHVLATDCFAAAPPDGLRTEAEAPKRQRRQRKPTLASVAKQASKDPVGNPGASALAGGARRHTE